MRPLPQRQASETMTSNTAISLSNRPRRPNRSRARLCAPKFPLENLTPTPGGLPPSRHAMGPIAAGDPTVTDPLNRDSKINGLVGIGGRDRGASWLWPRSPLAGGPTARREPAVGSSDTARNNRRPHPAAVILLRRVGYETLYGVQGRIRHAEGHRREGINAFRALISSFSS